MKQPYLVCGTESRRELVRNKKMNGLDYLEVSEDQRVLTVHFLGRAPEVVEKENVLIEGGTRIRNITIAEKPEISRHYPEFDDWMEITVSEPGDYSIYTLKLVEAENGRATDRPLKNFDPRYASLDFSFKAGCPSNLDCKPEEAVLSPERLQPEIDYLARDYAGFRQLILDRLSLNLPDWKERHVPDLGIALVEILAYIGDHLSYYQDAVATESYLDTSRQRISVRRHVRLVDYRMHEGCNSRAWIFLETDTDFPTKSQDIYLEKIYFITGLPGDQQYAGIIAEDYLRSVSTGSYQIFVPVLDHDYSLRPEEIDLDGMASSLKDTANLVSQYLKRQLSIDVQKMIDSYRGLGPSIEQLQSALVKDLNKLMKSYSLYDPLLFSGVKLRPDTGDLIGGDLKGDDLVRFNRLLLEDYYGKMITRKGTLRIYRAHNYIRFHTWGNKECCLAKGATGATLKDWEPGESGKGSAKGATEAKLEQEYADQECPPPEEPTPEPRPRILKLKPGDLLFFEEVIGPTTGRAEDADPSHRHVVRLTKVIPSEDQVMDEPVVEVEWSNEDALPFSLCISALGRPPNCNVIKDISVARGNLLLADHGGREEELLGTVQTKETERTCLAEDLTDEITIEPAVFSAQLKKSPLTFSQPVEPGLPASRLLKQDPREALPCLELCARSEKKSNASLEDSGGLGSGCKTSENKWSAVPDLLASDSLDRDFVAEMDDEGFAHLRFGDGELGRMPEAGMQFRAVYRLGNGPEGNVGRGMITHIVFRGTLQSGLNIRPRNPLPASGGTAREKIEDVKLIAPHAFRKKLQRAITAGDYARLAQGPGVQRAAATLRWTGSWHEAMVAVDPLGSVLAEDDLLQEVETSLYPYRRMGHDLAVRPAHYVALDIELTVCILPNYLRGHVEADLLVLFSNRTMADGKPGFFHPDNLTFGDGIYSSRLMAAAQAVAGVESVIVDKLERLFEGPNHEIKNGLLPLGPFEIARLDNDPSFPENGVLTLNIQGGR